MKKEYVTYNEVHKMVKELSEKIISSGYDPDIIVAIGSGGFIPARILKTFINRPIYAVGISYYGLDQKHKSHPQKIQWIDQATDQLKGKKILLIDEVDDTRATLGYCVGELLKHDISDIAVLVLHNKEKEKDVSFPAEVQKYFAAKNTQDVWINYPWDAKDIDNHGNKE